MLRALDAIIRYGLMLLLIWPPLVFGAVHSWAYALMEIHVFLLVAAWMAQLIVTQRLRLTLPRFSPPLVYTLLAAPLAPRRRNCSVVGKRLPI